MSGRQVERFSGPDRLLAVGVADRHLALQHEAPKTVRNHIEHIYVKIGASSRVTAGLFAMDHGLLPVTDGVDA